MDWIVALAVAVAAAAVNNSLHMAPARRRSTVVNVGVGVVGVAAAVWLVLQGDPWAGFVAGALWTFGALVAVVLLGVVASWSARVGAAFADRRMARMPRDVFVRHVALRIPLLSALAEEVVFRGVVYDLLEAAGGTLVAVVGSAVAFGCSHVAVGAVQAEREGRQPADWVAVTVAATTAAGVALAVLRWVTGGVWAGVGVHAVVNAGLAVLARRHDAGASSPVAPPKSEA